MCVCVIVLWYSREGVWQEWHKIAINHWRFVNELKVVHSLSHSRQGLSVIQNAVCVCRNGMNSLFRTHHEYWWAQTNGRYKNRVFVGIVAAAAGWCDVLSTHKHFWFCYFLLLLLLLLLLHHHLFRLSINLPGSPSFARSLHAILCNKKHTRVWSFTFSTSPPYGPLFDLRLIIAQTLFTHRFSWWEWNLSESN